MERSVHDWFTSSLPTWRYWRGVPMQKNPIDLQLYHEAIWETRPNVIVETGTMHGGSALFFADMMSLSHSDGGACVLTIDTVDRGPYPFDDRIDAYVEDSATWKPPSPEYIGVDDLVMVVLDSDHTAEHVRLELANLAHLVTPGCYLVIEDTSHTEAGQAVEDWSAHHPEFRPVDMSRYLCTYNTWLIREET